MPWIHLQKLLPAEYQRDLIKAGVCQLDVAVECIRAFERADATIRLPPTGLNRTQSSTTTAQQPAQPEPTRPPRACYVCGLPDHVRSTCPFQNDIGGQCERRGHLSTVSRGQPRQPRGRGQVPERSWGNRCQSARRGPRQTVFNGGTVAPLTWAGEDQLPVSAEHQQDPLLQSARPWIPLQQPPLPESQQGPAPLQQPTS